MKSNTTWSIINLPLLTLKNKTYRIINIRPSVDVTVAYIDYNVRAIINDMKFVTAYTKVKLHIKTFIKER